MRSQDLVGTAVGGLWRQKARALLTGLGIAVGSCALAFCLSLGLGLRAMIDREFQGRPGFWTVYVRPAAEPPPIPEAEIPPEAIAIDPTVTDPARRERIRQRLIARYQWSHNRLPPVRLTPEVLDRIRQIPDVQSVTAWQLGRGRIRVGDGLGRDATIVAGPLSKETVTRRVVLGSLPTTPDGVLVSEFLLYDVGYRSEADVARLLGQPIVVTVGTGGGSTLRMQALAGVLGLKSEQMTASDEALVKKTIASLPKALAASDLTMEEKARLSKLGMTPPPAPGGRGEAPVQGTFRIAGVIRALTPEDLNDENHRVTWEEREAEVFLTEADGLPLFRQLPEVRDRGFQSATVQIRPGGDLPTVVAAIAETGVDHQSSLRFFESSKREVTLISAGLNLFALISLFVAALGITNTLVTSVVERTREIGIWKAIGATDRQVMGVFLTEGAVIGLLGGVVGLIGAWGLSIPGDGLVRRLVQEQSRQTLLSTSVFEFPPWLIGLTIAFAVLVTTMAALYPARRAARVDPVEALRHE